MAKTNRKESRKIYEGYKKRQRLWNTIFIVFFAVIGIGSAVLNGTMELDPQIVIGKYEFTWFHLVILAVLVVLLGFGIVALKRDSSEEQQEIYRQEREEAIRLRQEVMAERKQEMQDAYNAMKRRRAERHEKRREPRQQKVQRQPQRRDDERPAQRRPKIFCEPLGHGLPLSLPSLLYIESASRRPTCSTPILATSAGKYSL